MAVEIANSVEQEFSQEVGKRVASVSVSQYSDGNAIYRITYDANLCTRAIGYVVRVGGGPLSPIVGTVEAAKGLLAWYKSMCKYELEVYCE